MGITITGQAATVTHMADRMRLGVGSIVQMALPAQGIMSKRPKRKL
jgi:hypothetical protein